MSGNINKDCIGFPFATVEKNKLYLNDKAVEDGFDTFNTKNNQKIQIIPNKTRERDVIYVFGASGSGKSYWIKQYLQEYHKMYKNREVFLFSSLSDDKAFDSLKFVKRMKIKEEKFMSTDLTAEDFKDTLCIFDDVDVINQIKTRKKVMELLNNLLETGRHYNVSVIYTSHLASNGLESRRILNEAHMMVCFPTNISGRASKYFFENYLSLNKDQIIKLKNLPSRAVCFIKSFPQLIVWETGASLLKSF